LNIQDFDAFAAKFAGVLGAAVSMRYLQGPGRRASAWRTSGTGGMTRGVRFTASETANMLIEPPAKAGQGMTGGVAIGVGTTPIAPVAGVVQL